MHNWKLSHLGWHAHGAAAAVEEKQNEEDRRVAKQTAVWSAQWLQSYIITAHIHWIVHIGAHIQTLYLAGWLAHFCALFISLSFSLCVVCIDFYLANSQIHSQLHVVIVSKAMHFIIVIIHVPPHAFISTWAPILTGTANGFFIEIKSKRKTFSAIASV